MNLGTYSDLAYPCPGTALPTGYHSLEGRFVAMERGGLVRKTKPAWRDFKKRWVPFHSYLSDGFAKLYENNYSRENQQENVANKQDIKRRLQLKAQQEKKCIRIQIKESYLQYHRFLCA